MEFASYMWIFFFSVYKSKIQDLYLWYWITAAWNKLRSCLKTRTLFFFTLLSWPQAASVSQYITVVFSVLAYFRKLQWASTHFIETTHIKKWLKMVNWFCFAPVQVPYDCKVLKSLLMTVLTENLTLNLKKKRLYKSNEFCLTEVRDTSPREKYKYSASTQYLFL